MTVPSTAGYDAPSFPAPSLQWTAPISGLDISSATPKACPECRAIIHSVLRYGRILRYAELKVLERKNDFAIDKRIAALVDFAPQGEIKAGESENHSGWERRLRRLTELLRDIRKSPTRKVSHI